MQGHLMNDYERGLRDAIKAIEIANANCLHCGQIAELAIREIERLMQPKPKLPAPKLPAHHRVSS
jgi:hypothetical protein